MAGGRPSDFTPEIANEICERLAKGESLRTITGADRDDFMPSETTVRRWLAGEEDWSAEFRRQYAHARDCQADHYAEEIIAIADCTDVPLSRVDAPVPPRDPQRDRLRIDARKWYASKLAPKKYGERQTIEHEGGISTLTDDQIEEKIATLMAGAGAGPA